MSEDIRKPFSIPRFKLPAVFARVGNKLPQWPHAVALSLIHISEPTRPY